MKKFFTTLCLLIGLTFIAQAQLNIGLPPTLTYGNAPDSIKASLFSTDSTAMPFDSLYITVGTPWTETVNFYHSSRGADISTGLNASYVFTATPTAANAVGKRPKEAGTRGPKCNFNDLETFETTDDGFLRDNKRTETTTLHYGWHKIQATKTYTCSHTQTQNLSRDRKWLIVYYWDNHKVNSTVDNGYSSIYKSTTYTYMESTYISSEEAPYESADKPKNSANSLPNNWQELVDNESWNPEPLTTPNDSHFTGDAKTATYSSTKSKDLNIIDYIYIWATKEEIERGTFTLPATNAEIEALINRSTTNSTGNTFNVTQSATLYDIVGQVRHHFTVGTPNSANYGTCHYNYYDTTWYDLNYSYNGQRYNSSNPSASYHEYDTNYETTEEEEITKIVNGESKSEYYSNLINNQPAVAMLVYYKKNDSAFQYIRTANPRTQRAGRITDKKIYIRAYVNDLHWNSGDMLGWMQPVNCDIYLDNVRLRAANDTTTNYLFNETLAVDYPNLKKYNFETKNPLLASVFVLPEGNTTIHTKGDNYLAGSMGQRIHIKLKVVVSAFETADLLTRIVETYMPNYSAPIAIKGAHLFDNNTQPNISCTFDAQWADNTNTNGYIDLSTRICQHPDSTKNKGTTNDYKVTPSSTSSSKLEAVVKWTTHKGYRYAAPLNTGGPNGTFSINGGRINLWPANGHAAQVELNSYGSKLGMEIYISIHGGKYSNYLVCGNSQWKLLCDGNTFVRTDDSQIYATDGSTIPNTKLPLNIDIATLMKDYPSTATLYGIGNGVPEGHLIINGGTISANTDPNSFAYKWIDYDMTTKKSTEKTSENVADDGSGQPLFGPNVVINGGTFLHPLYGTTDHGTGSALHKASYNRDELNPISQWNNNGILDYDDPTDYKAFNKYGDPVSRAAYALPEASKDYTAFNEINITAEPEAHNPLAEEGKIAVIGNAGAENEYLYGMTNVWSDEKALGYFYLPSGNNVFMQNYYVQSGETVSTFDLTQSSVTTTYQPYHLWIDKGGQITIADGYKVHGRPYYRSTYTADLYQTIAMPFTAKRFFVTDSVDKQFQFYSYVEIGDAEAAGVPEDRREYINNNAYCYLYFLDDEATAPDDDVNITHDQCAKGVNDTFRSYYHTHTDGSTMEKGKTYIIKFPKWEGYDDYWERNIVTLQGEKGQTVNGTFTFATRPAATANDTENPTFIMDGNATFASQDISDPESEVEVYLVDPTTWGDDSFHATKVSTLAPMQGYLVGSTNTMQRYRIIGREGKVEQTALDQLIHTGWTAVGAHQAMLIMTPQDATARIYTADGKLWKTISLTANTGVVVNAPAGFYIVQAGNESKKVLVH